MVPVDTSLSSFFMLDGASVIFDDGSVFSAGIRGVGLLDMELFFEDPPPSSLPASFRLEFGTSFGMVSLRVTATSVMPDGSFFVMQVRILSSNLNSFFMPLREFCEFFRDERDKRLRAFVSTRRNLLLLSFRSMIMLDLQGRIYHAVVRRLSGCALTVLVSPDFFQCRRMRFSFVIRVAGRDFSFSSRLVVSARPRRVMGRLFAEVGIALSDERRLWSFVDREARRRERGRVR